MPVPLVSSTHRCDRPAGRFLLAMLVVAACAGRTTMEVDRVTADMETDPVTHGGDAADDAVVIAGEEGGWVRIVGTDKQAGLVVYDLTGRLETFLAAGRLNNVDAVRRDDGSFLVAASNRTTPGIELFLVDPAGVGVTSAGRIDLALAEPYGLCMGRTPATAVFVGDKEGRVEHWVLDDHLRAELAGHFEFDSLTEGCVFDAADGTLYVGEEARGIWAVDRETGARTLLDEVGDGFLVADVEGLDIYTDPVHGSRYLVASSQGDDTFAVFQLPSGERLAKFAIVADDASGIDGAEDTDGVAIFSLALPGYPNGLIVVQDGFNRRPRERQNFKVVDWRKIQALLSDP